MQVQRQLIANLVLHELIASGRTALAQKLILSMDKMQDPLPLRLRKLLQNRAYDELMEIMPDEDLRHLVLEFQAIQLLNANKQEEALVLLRTHPLVGRRMSTHFLGRPSAQQCQQAQRQLYLKLVKTLSPESHLACVNMDRLLKKGWAEDISHCQFHATIQSHLPMFESTAPCARPAVSFQKKAVHRVSSQAWLARLNTAETLLSVACENGDVSLFDVTEDLAFLKMELLFERQQIIVMEWKEGRDQLLVACRRGIVKVVDHQLRVLQQIESDSFLMSACYFKDGILTSEENHSITIYSQQGLIRTRLSSKTKVQVLAAGDKFIATSPLQRLISLVDPASKVEEHRIQEDSEITELVLSKDKRILFYSVSEGRVNEIRMWDLMTGRMLNRWPYCPSRTEFLRLALGGTCDSLLTVGSSSGNVSLWHTGRSEKLGEFQVSSSMVSEARLNGRGDRLFVAADDGTVSLWVEVEGKAFDKS